MTENPGGTEMSDSSDVAPRQQWIPEEILQNVSPEEVRYAHGFLQSRPESLFPGLASHWLPLFHSLDISVSLHSAQPTLTVDGAGGEIYLASLEDELLGLIVPLQSFDLLGNILLPDGTTAGHHIVVEYFARRLLSSLAHSWSAADSAAFRFESDLSMESPRFAGGVVVRMKVDSEDLTFTIGVGKHLLQQLHELWIAHLNTETTDGEDDTTSKVELVIGSSYLKPSQISSQLQPGQILSLSPDTIRDLTLFLDDEPWLSAELLISEGKYVLRSQGEDAQAVIHGTVPPEGTTRVRALIGEANLSRSQLSRLKNSNTLLPLDIASSNQAMLIIGEQEVGTAELVVTEGTLSAEVLTVTSD